MSTTVAFKQIADHNIFYSLTEPDPSQKKIVIMSHGFRGSSIGPARSFVDFEHLLVANGISVLRFDQAGSGNSAGNFLNSSFRDWVHTTTTFAQTYLDQGYQVALLGQSMGASTTVIATAAEAVRDRIVAIMLWVPDPKSDFEVEPDQVYEEDGQKYRGRFWQEAREADFFGCLDKYPGGIHLVFGDQDRYIPDELRQRVIAKVTAKGQPCLILPHQDHSPWDYDLIQQVYQEELAFLQKHFI